jgi:predicted permease
MVEGLLLSLLGGALGVGVAYGGVRIVNAVAYEPYFRALGIDVNVLIFAGLLSVLTPLLVCLWPAMSAGRSATVDTLRDSRTSGGHAVKVRRNVLVAGQVALALSMLVLSALAVKSMMYVRAIDLGVDVARIALFRYELPPDRYATDDARARFAETLSAHLAQGGGVSAAAVVSHLPVFDGEVTRQVEGLVRHSGDSDQPWVSWYSVTPGFFQTAGVPLLAGRAFSGSDRAGTEPLVILNKTAAERYFGGIDQAVGRTVVLAVTGQTSRSVTVAGVAADTRSPMILTTSPQAYVPFAQWPAAEVVALVRSNAPAARMPDMRAVMRGLDAAVPITDLRTLQDKADDEESSDAILYGLFVAFALLALALAASGLYGVISYSVGQRTREIGVRLVLGAQPAGITRMVLVEGLTVTGIGVLAGLLLGLLLAKMAAPVLQGVSPTDPAAFLLVTMVVLSVAVVSILSPAVRAMRMDPARTLRGD